MAHVRKQVRDWLKAALKGSPEAGDRVEVRRALPLGKDFQPTLLLSIGAERVAEVATGGVQSRIVEVRVTACVKDDSEDGEDTLDALSVFVERVFANDPSLGGLALDYQYELTEFGFNGDGEKTLCTAAMTFGVMVETDRADPETAH